MWARWCTDPQPISLDHVADADLLFGNQSRYCTVPRKGLFRGYVRSAAACLRGCIRTVSTSEVIASTERQVLDANTHRLSARVDMREEWFETEAIAVIQIVDRIGAGNAFAAGVLSCIDMGCAAVAERGLALGALKHATEGDQSRTTPADFASFTGQPAYVRR